MKRVQRRDILGELFLSHEGSDGSMDVCMFVVQSQQACQPLCVCVCEHLQRAGACAPVTLDGTRVAVSAEGEVCSTLMCAGTVRVCV